MGVSHQHHHNTHATMLGLSILLLACTTQAAQHFRYFPQIQGRSDHIQIPSKVKAPTGRPNLIHLVDNSGKDALIAFVQKDDRKIRRRKTTYKPWEKRMLLKERSPPPPSRRVLLRKVPNKSNRQLRPRIKMRKDEGSPALTWWTDRPRSPRCLRSQ